MNQPMTQFAFTAGEVSPYIEGRFDLQAFSVAAKKLENFLVLTHGGVTKRPGTEFLEDVGDAILIPFIYADGDSYMLVFKTSVMEVWRNGQKLSGVSVAHSYSLAQRQAFKWTQSFDVMTIVGPTHPPFEVKRVEANTWTISDKFFGTKVQAPEMVSVYSSKLTSTSPPKRTYKVAPYTYDAASPVTTRVISATLGSGADTLGQTSLNLGALDVIHLNWAIGSNSLGWRIFKDDVCVREIIYPQFASSTAYAKYDRVAIRAANVSQIPATETALIQELTESGGTLVFECRTAHTSSTTIDMDKFIRVTMENLAISSDDALTESGGAPPDVTGPCCHVGSGVPASSLGIKNDHYYDTASGKKHVKIDATTWDAGSAHAAVTAFFYVDAPLACAINGSTVTTASASAYAYKVVTVDADGKESAESVALSTTNDLVAARSGNFVYWREVEGAAFYKIYRSHQGGNFVYLGRSNGQFFMDANVAPTTEEPRKFPTMFASEGNYPSAVAYHQQRLIFAGTQNEPTKIWFSGLADYSNFSVTTPVRDDSPITIGVAATRASKVIDLISADDLAVLTTGGFWRITGNTRNDALTPTNLTVIPQGNLGTADLQPIMNQRVLVFVAKGGHSLHSMSYNLTTDGYEASDMSILSQHLFEDDPIIKIAAAYVPFGMVFCLRESGTIAVLSMNTEHKVTAWSTLKFPGAVTSMGVASESDRDVLYLVVDGKLCQLSPSLFAEWHDANRLDLALPFNPWDESTPGTLTSGSLVYPVANAVFATNDIICLRASGSIHDRLRFKVLSVSGTTPTKTYTLGDEDGNAVSPWQNGAVWAAKCSDSISGLTHLANKDVMVQAKEGVYGDQDPLTVSGGGVLTLPEKISQGWIGLKMEAELRTLDIQVNGVSPAARKQANQIAVRMLRSQAAKIAPVDAMGTTRQSSIIGGPSRWAYSLAPRPQDQPAATAPDLFSGVARATIAPNFDTGSIAIKSDMPFPLTILDVTPEVKNGQ